MKYDIIAEIGQAHDGSLGIAHSYIDALAETGVTTIKFQNHIAEAESSIFEPFRINFSYQDKTRYDYWKRMEFSFDQWCELKRHCEDKGLEFLASPFSVAAVEMLEKLNVKRYKIGSGEVNNHLLIEKIAATNKKVILSSGMSNYNELDSTINLLKTSKIDYSILQCTTSYPTKTEQWGLNIIPELKKRYGVPVGFSDHSGDIYASLFAASKGAEIFEFHAVFNKKIFGPDSTSSLTMKQIKKLILGLDQYIISENSKVDKDDLQQYNSLKNIFEKSLCVNKDLKKGHIISINDLETKKPKGKGVNSSEYKNILNKKINHDLKKWDFINEKNFK
ncbi:N-acetylneuraminate synthase family protein [Flavobacteriaceae bacterium]|nr:N-acetylneuraminate synthase family protein [Flavobacteriaceae bacterium]